MSLYVEVTGNGEPLVLLHGWGMHGGIWGEVVPRLAQRFQVHCVDLPGHGLSGRGESFLFPSSPFTLDTFVDELDARFDRPVSVMGWSLGGIIALAWAAREPGRVRRLALVASTPCFSERQDWRCGMPLATLQQFAAELEQNHAATLRRFLALQLRGSDRERELLALMRDRLFSRGMPDVQALRGGLDILRDTDLRSLLPRINTPCLALAGERDKLTPPEASRYLARAMPNARALEIAAAAHAPFLSHPEVFMEQVFGFLLREND